MTETPVLWGFTLADFDRVIPYSGQPGTATRLFFVEDDRPVRGLRALELTFHFSAVGGPGTVASAARSAQVPNSRSLTARLLIAAGLSVGTEATETCVGAPPVASNGGGWWWEPLNHPRAAGDATGHE